MGRSFQSVRMGVNDIAERWGRAARAMRRDDAACADKVVAMAKTCASEAFYAFDDPLEAAIFSVLICMSKEHGPDGGHVVPGDVPTSPVHHLCNPAGNQTPVTGKKKVVNNHVDP
jgi:hypothetical protein